MESNLELSIRNLIIASAFKSSTTEECNKIKETIESTFDGCDVIRIKMSPLEVDVLNEGKVTTFTLLN